MWWLDGYDIVGGFLFGLYWAHTYADRVPVTTKVILPPEPDELPEPPSSYIKGYEALIRKLEVAAKFGDGIRFNAVGAQAMANIMEDLCHKLDRAVKLAITSRPDHDPNVRKIEKNVDVQRQARVRKPSD